jgi:transcriptional regulator with XRE-family HTH domain
MGIEKTNPFSPYEFQFSIQDRKSMIAEMIRELRKSKSLQQKEVADKLGISPQTYNGYERGRNEPPIEILVRLSYLYDLPLDLIVQRDRLHKDSESAMVTLAKMEDEMTELRAQIKAAPNAAIPQADAIMDMLKQLIDTSKTVVSQVEAKDKK